MKKQVVVIHGGNSFPNYTEYILGLKKIKLDLEHLTKPEEKRWKKNLPKNLGSSFQVFSPDMPNWSDAKYLEWKIWFEKITPFLKDGVVLVGHSLGAIFLTKYLSETKFSKKIRGTFLVAGPYEEKGYKGKYLIPEFRIPKSLNKLEKQGGQIFLYHSKDDKVVPFRDAKKYEERLPNAKLTIFKDRGHFRQTTFPELVRDIKSLY